MIDVLKKLYNALQTFLSNYSEAIGSIPDISELQTDVGTLQTDVGGLQTDVGGLQTDVGNLQTAVGGLQTDVTALKSNSHGVCQAQGDCISSLWYRVNGKIVICGGSFLVDIAGTSGGNILELPYKPTNAFKVPIVADDGTVMLAEADGTDKYLKALAVAYPNTKWFVTNFSYELLEDT